MLFDQVKSYSTLKQLETQKTITKENPTALNKLKLSILYHDAALLYTDTWEAERLELAEEAYTILTIMVTESVKHSELLPYAKAYHASTTTMLGAAYKNTTMVDQGFALFEQAIDRFGEESYLPLYMRAKVAEQLPFPYTKRKLAKQDYSELIDKYGLDKSYSTPKAMSFVYVSWVELHSQKKYKDQAERYLHKAIQLDSNKDAAASAAEKMLKSNYLNEEHTVL